MVGQGGETGLHIYGRVIVVVSRIGGVDVGAAGSVSYGFRESYCWVFLVIIRL